MNSISDLRNLMQIANISGIGGLRIRALMARFKRPENILSASYRELLQVEGIDKVIAHNIIKYQDDGFSDTQMELIQKHHVKTITFWDKEYPTNLKKIYDPPVILFIKGTIVANDDHAVSIVGTRNPGQYGKAIAEKIGAELSTKGITIISGLARGIDTAAHWGAVNAGGRTIAVLGSAVNKVYPCENINLANSIQQQGALVSELPMDTGPDAPNFPRRNRIIAGLGKIIIVVEAGAKSGALITATIAAEQNRDVYAVPGNITSPKSVGTNRLIRDGAHIFLNIDEFLAEVEPQLGLKNSQKETSPAISLSGHEKVIYEALSPEPIHIDALAKKCQLTTSKTLAILLTLELKNVVKQLAGKMFVRN